MRKLLGPHLAGQWANKLELLRQWQPHLCLVLQPEVDKVKQLRAACPDTIIVGRMYHEDNHYASNIQGRPEEFALDIHREIIANPATPLLDYVQTNNETNQGWEGIQQLNVFTQRWMHLADQSQAYKCAILTFSVGNPDLPHKPGDPAGFDGRMLYWQQVLPSLNYAQRNDHILLLHAYGYPDLFHPDADWYIYRYERQVAANLRTLGITNLRYAYGEIGIDRLLVGDKGGYKAVPTGDQDYVNQLLQWERDQQGQSQLLGGAIYTFGDSGGWGSYDITSTNVASMLAAHYADRANEYESSAIEGQNTMTETFLPNVGTGSSPAIPDNSLPPRDWDERLTQRGVTVETPQVAPGQAFWRITKARWYDEQQAGGRHHIYVDAPAGRTFRVEWPSGSTTGTANGRGGFDARNFPMSKSLNEFSVRMDVGTPSETLTGIGMGADGNSGIHTSTEVRFVLVTMPQTQAQPTPEPIEQPTPTAPPTVIDRGEAWPRIYAFIKRWEGGWADNPNDLGGATNKGVTIGTFQRWRESRGLPTPTKDDLRYITDAEAEQIFFEWYYKASGADKLNWPLSLAQTDTAVNAGVGRAQEMLTKSDGNFLTYMGHLIDWYTRIDNFEHFGRAWIRRRAEILLEAST